ncbi:MAG: RidA family protein, partial [Actinomycetota bacterium]
MSAAPIAIRPARFPWFDYSRYTFSLGIARDGDAWLSGHSASEYDAQAERIVVRGGMAEQTRTAYAKIAAILEAAGLTLADARRIVEYVTAEGIERYAEAAGVRDALLGGHRPPVCTVVVNRLLRPAALIEIEVTAGGSLGPGADVVYLP